MNKPQLDGAGLGLRREHMLPLMTNVPASINFFEISPENYLDLGVKEPKIFTGSLNGTPLWLMAYPFHLAAQIL